MDDTERPEQTNAQTLTQGRILRTQGLFAEYTTGQTPAGEWFALGSVRREASSSQQPAWLLVGTGTTVEDAISGLLTELEHQALKHTV